VPELLPRFSKAMQAIEDARKLGQILMETGDVPEVTRATAAGDPRRLRGLPAVGRGSGGAIHGTNPLHALLAKERTRRR
jgi:hypothetical protein